MPGPYPDPKIEKTLEILDLVEVALLNYARDNNSLPIEENKLIWILCNEGKNPPYINLHKIKVDIACHPQGKEIFIFDGWGNPLRYKYLGKNSIGEEGFMIYSYGFNRVDENGEGDDLYRIRYIPLSKDQEECLSINST